MFDSSWGLRIFLGPMLYNDEEIKFFIISLPSSKFTIFLIQCTNMMLSTMLITQADHTMCLWLIIVDMRQTKSMRVLNKSLNIAYLN